jgi:hypothetical protein
MPYATLDPQEVDMVARLFRQACADFARRDRVLDVINRDVNSEDGNTLGTFTIDDMEMLEGKIGL